MPRHVKKNGMCAPICLRRPLLNILYMAVVIAFFFFETVDKSLDFGGVIKMVASRKLS